MAILVPLILLGACLVVKLRQTAKEKRGDYDDYDRRGDENPVYRSTTVNNRYGDVGGGRSSSSNNSSTKKRGKWSDRESDSYYKDRTAVDNDYDDEDRRYVDTDNLQRASAPLAGRSDSSRSAAGGSPKFRNSSSSSSRAAKRNNDRNRSRESLDIDPETSATSPKVDKDFGLFDHHPRPPSTPGTSRKEPESTQKKAGPDSLSPPTTASSSARSSSRSGRPQQPLPPPAADGLTTTDDGGDTTDNKYDQVYYTQEPLVGKPPVEFPPKQMDVDIDIKNYRGHQGGSRPSVL